MGLNEREIERLIKEHPEQLKRYVMMLQNRIFLNSSNSSLPPSSDFFKTPKNKKIKSNREKSGRKPGGQKGHDGATYSIASVDRSVDLLSMHCQRCGLDLSEYEAEHVATRYVKDLNEHWKNETTAYKCFEICCPACSHLQRSIFPDNISARFQYGRRVKSLITYMNAYQLIPVERTQEFLKEIFHFEVSKGAIVDISKRFADDLSDFLLQVQSLLRESDVINCDETGMHHSASKQWVHVASTALMTLITSHKNRGVEGINAAGVLPEYKGTAVHDGWKAYFDDGYACSHGLCNAHHLRELRYVEEEMRQRWAKYMRVLLLDIKEAVEKRKAQGYCTLSREATSVFEQRYQEILQMGLRVPANKKRERKGRRGRLGQSKSKNLLDRLANRSAVLAFMYDFAVPFDNNQAEQDIRMMKVKKKISGCFRSAGGLAAFCSIRSYLSTLRKNCIPIFDGIMDAMQGNATAVLQGT